MRPALSFSVVSKRTGLKFELSYSFFVVRLNERLKEAAKSHLPGDGLRDVGPATDDEDGVLNNLRQQLTLALHVGKVL